MTEFEQAVAGVLEVLFERARHQGDAGPTVRQFITETIAPRVAAAIDIVAQLYAGEISAEQHWVRPEESVAEARADALAALRGDAP